MIRGYRWILTGRNVWQLEGPPKSRRFHGCVSGYSGHDFRWHTGYAEQYEQGEVTSKRRGQDEVEKRVAARNETTGPER